MEHRYHCVANAGSGKIARIIQTLSRAFSRERRLIEYNLSTLRPLGSEHGRLAARAKQERALTVRGGALRLVHIDRLLPGSCRFGFASRALCRRTPNGISLCR